MYINVLFYLNGFKNVWSYDINPKIHCSVFILQGKDASIQIWISSFIQINQICKTKISKFKAKFNHLYLFVSKSSSMSVCRCYHEQLSEAAIHRHICSLWLTFMHSSALSKPISMLIMSNPEVDLFFWWTPRMSAHKVCRHKRKNSF